MTVVAKKTDGILLMYSVSILLGLVAIGISISRFETLNILVMIVGIIMTVFPSYSIVKYIRTPHEIITVDNKGILHLPKEVTLDPRDIIDVSYKCARGKSYTYDWGEVIIITHIESFKFDYVDNCEDVSKELTRMMYESRVTRII